MLSSQLSQGCCESCEALVQAARNEPYPDTGSRNDLDIFYGIFCYDNMPYYDDVCDGPYALDAIIESFVQGVDDSMICYLLNFCPNRCECC